LCSFLDEPGVNDCGARRGSFACWCWGNKMIFDFRLVHCGNRVM
jgi:hypothetical protein